MSDNGKKPQTILEVTNLGDGKIEVKLYSKKMAVLCTALKLVELQIENEIIRQSIPKPVIEIPPSIRKLMR